MNRYTYFIGLCLTVVSCNSVPESERLAKRYCSCMIENDAIDDFRTADRLCIRALMENRYLRIEMIDMRDRELDKKLSQLTRDSTLKFVDSFTSYIESHCCKEIGLCDVDSTVEVPDSVMQIIN